MNCNVSIWSKWTGLLVTCTYLGVHIINLSELEKCSSNFTSAIIITSSIMWLTSICYIIRSYGYLQTCTSRYLECAYFAVGYSIGRSAGMMFSPPIFKCTPRYLFIIDTVFLGSCYVCSVLIILSMVFFCIRKCVLKRRRISAEKELETVYSELFKDRFDVERFIKKHQSVIDTYGMKPKDREFMRDHLAYQLSAQQVEMLLDTNKQTCSICLGDFEAGETICPHPSCGHLFHWNCIEPWVSRAEHSCQCPLCKRPTLSNLLRELKAMHMQKKTLMTEGTELNPLETCARLIDNNQAQLN